MSAEMEQLQISSTLSMQQSRDLSGNSESVAAGSVEITQTNSCSDQEITTRQPVALTDTNFAKVYDVLSDVRDKWFNIGLQLGIGPAALKDIEKKYPESMDALREVLIVCTSQRKIELKDLIEALHKPTVDQPVCARKLEDLVKELQRDENESATGSRSTGGKDGEKAPFSRVTRLTKREARKAECAYRFEVVIVGDPTVGKTTTANKYFDVHPDHELGRSTIAVTQHDPRVFEYKGKRVQLVLRDMPGNDECFDKVEPCNFESADGAILMFDVTNKQSFINLISDKDNSRKIRRSWRKELMFKAIDSKHPVMVLVGNKIDAKRREIQRSDVEEMLKSRNLDLPYFEISAKEGLELENVFASFVEMLIKKASEDSRYGQVTRTDHYNSKSIQASTVTHPFEDEELMVPRTKSLPPSRSNQIVRSPPQSTLSPQAQQEPQPGTVSNSGDNARRCVIL